MTATVQIPEKPITLMQAARLLAEAVRPGNPDALLASLNFILKKAHCGEVRGRYPLTLVPFDTAGISPLDYASLMVLTPNDIRLLAAECDFRVEAEDVLKSADPIQDSPAPSDTSPALAQPRATAPAVSESASNPTAVPFRKSALISAHICEWPTIKRDIADAHRNGLAAAAKAGARGWLEDSALAWAKAKGRLKNTEKPVDSLAQAMHNMSNLPSRRNTIQD